METIYTDFISNNHDYQVEFLLEQMRLALAKKDYVTTQIISKKISPKFFKDKENADVSQI